jgi:hypothetical protein
MTIMLSFEQSVAYLEGQYPAFLVELDTVETLYLRGITEPTAVILVDGTVAFYVANGEVL